MLATSRAAEAYVRYQTSTGIGYAWRQTCVPVTVYPADQTDLTPEQTLHAVSAAAAAWSADQNACTFMRINVDSSTAPTPTATLDYRSSVIFRQTSWCAPSDSPGTCSYDPSALAITSVFVTKSDGKILDADVEVNAKNFLWGDLVLTPSGIKQDLQNVLTHEMGHLLGLAGTCVRSGSPVPLDNAGQPVPQCDSASPAVEATTMFESTVPGETSKRTLAPDDILGVCDIYPKAMDPRTCPAAGADGGADGDVGDVPTDATLDIGVAEVGSDASRDATLDVGVAEAGNDAPRDAALDLAVAEAGGHTGVDASGAPRVPAAGCGCEMGRRSPAAASTLALALLVATARRRRRR
jgi:hypothetical protein